MDSVVLFSIIAIVILAIILFATLFSQTKPKEVKSSQEKQAEIINGYKMQLRDALLPLHDNPEILKQKKSALLQEISHELARNIFFDQNEMRVVIRELANYNYEDKT